MRWMNRETAVSQNEGSIGNMPVTRYEVNPDYGLTEKQVQVNMFAMITGRNVRFRKDPTIHKSAVSTAKIRLK